MAASIRLKIQARTGASRHPSDPLDGIGQGTVANVTAAVIEKLRARGQPCRLSGERTRIETRDWSIGFDIPLADGAPHRRLFVKIPKFPDPRNEKYVIEPGEIARRVRNEFKSLKVIHDHFTRLDEPGLSAFEPVMYLADFDAIVMAFAEGQALQDALFPGGWMRMSGDAGELRESAFRAGRWLNALHRIDLDVDAGDENPSPTDPAHALKSVAAELRAFGIRVERWTGWADALRRVSSAHRGRQVWCHGDFHVRNIYLLAGGAVAGFDTVLQKDNPYTDIGKLLADLRIQKVVKNLRGLARGGHLPDQDLLRLRESFCAGYGQGDPIDPLTLALYEGGFLAERWSHALRRIRPARAWPLRGAHAALKTRAMNSVFERLMRQWISVVLSEQSH